MTEISVIIPVYNTEMYLEQCLNSVLQQTFKDIEIICVNDGSTDNSLHILELLASQDERIKIFNQENLGLSEARNRGIKEAIGKYISFIDSDDWIDVDFLEKLYLAAEKKQADIAAADILRLLPNGKTKKFIHLKKRVVTTVASKKFTTLQVPEHNYVINKLYLRTLITDNQLYFPKGRYFEDMFWMPQIVKCAQRIVTVADVFYYYRLNSTSITETMSKDLKKESDYKDGLKFIDNFIETNNIKVKFRFKERYIMRFLGLPILQIQKDSRRQYIYIFGLKLISIKHSKR